ncbi:uracil phosphoribosyltransferase [Talaromyces proteolyticus]|uniref:uracil phosphoribosyltransferase n=1 Tax=Talaromyces proteolyticus TaxID=1131652 RepID=A0AAD4PTF5_9EURO|nr:uracil phosphoribosyltransferase [Talaromyces proteolyticus]KAH8693210.1 uracil phosphoribosyltransferase [Talaromyces proteolyticus]
MASNISIINDSEFTAGLTKLRNRSLKPSSVRAIVSQLSTIVSKHAVATPHPPVASDETIAIVVILRSGIAMVEPFVSTLPDDTNMVIYHLGLFRERQTLQPIEYYNKLSKRNPSIKRAYILDPLIATGGTAAAAINIMKNWGIEKITFLSLVASKPGLEKAAAVWPENVHILVGAEDAELDDKGYVKPGLGDIGDRLFGTIFE